MKKLLLVFLILIPCLSFSQNNFRAMNWGDSVSDLKSTYPDAQWEIETEGKFKFYITDDYVGGLNVRVAYMFVDSKLKGGVYNFKESHSSNNLYYEDFLSISELLNKKYDMNREEKWNNDTFKDTPNQIGFALKMGDVEITENYEDEVTSITHSISSDGSGGIHHTLAYVDMDYVIAQRNSVLNDF